MILLRVYIFCSALLFHPRCYGSPIGQDGTNIDRRVVSTVHESNSVMTKVTIMSSVIITN